MKIYSYNVNGIRSALSKGLASWILSELPDMLCIQEIKATPEQVDLLELETAGYTTYWFPAQKKGYSGTALITRIKSDKVHYGIGHSLFDDEGRVIRADFGDLTLLCTYFPSGTTGDIRQAIKMEFLETYLQFISELKKTRPNLIVSGDYNICHKPIDINKPENKKGVSGFLPEERDWMDRFEASGFTDTFRLFNNQPEQYSWWSYRAGSRGKNLGWRIDYHWVSDTLRDQVTSAGILPQVVHSDHCPVWAEIKL